MEDVDVVHGDTGQIQMGVGTFGSRSAAVGGGAIVLSTQKIKEKARRLAAHLLEAAEADIVYEDGRLFVRGAPANAKTIQEIAARHKVHPNQVSTWKRQAMDGLGAVFSNGADKARMDHDDEVHDLHAKIGQLTVERDFLAKGLKR